ncbi:hypothetical protein PGSY75_1111200 [Plasmodium gaboni]|uniref:WW domain-containing protein n=1 Tax=Plasmodium gaboni TaxID=647221 RepID=A0A151LIE4_9APIC|nr:hypothetical protein PGSY75_1111200 [Plasmodium gaboni]KYN98750.1 hypothetical protein PGSY75_1111200 [Plasmodium gaboni]
MQNDNKIDDEEEKESGHENISDDQTNFSNDQEGVEHKDHLCKEQCDKSLTHLELEKYNNLSKDIQEYYVGVPYSWEYVEGSKSWFIVETSKNYKFFYNKKTNEKTWICPEEVEELLDKQNKEEYSDIKSEEENDYNSDDKKEDMDDILKAYKELLIEKQINEFSKYENVLATILYDSRYLNVPKDMRKEYFNKLIKEINEDKKDELKILIENFQSLLNKKEEYFYYPFNEHDVIKVLKNHKAYDGNKTNNWVQTRNRLLKNFLEKKTKETEKKVEHKFEDALINYLENENPKEWIKIKNYLMKKEKYDILSYKRKNQIFEQVSENMLKEIKKKKKRKYTSARDEKDDYARYENDKDEYDYDDRRKYSKKEFEDYQKEKTNEKNLFITILHEKLKCPKIDEELLKIEYNSIDNKNTFEDICLLPRDILNDERYKNITLNDNEKFVLYKEFINNYIDSKKMSFHKLLSELSINCINNTLDEVIHMIDKNNKTFKDIKKYHLEKNFNKWREYKIKEAKNIFKNFLLKFNYIKYNSDEQNNYKQLIDRLSQDVSYQRLNCIPEEREKIILSRIEELKEEHEKNKNVAERLNF